MSYLAFIGTTLPFCVPFFLSAFFALTLLDLLLDAVLADCSRRRRMWNMMKFHMSHTCSMHTAASALILKHGINSFKSATLDNWCNETLLNMIIFTAQWEGMDGWMVFQATFFALSKLNSAGDNLGLDEFRMKHCPSAVLIVRPSTLQPTALPSELGAASTMGGDGGYRVGEVKLTTTSPPCRP